MKLKSIDYIQHEGELKEWGVQDLTLGHVNLLVGKNATGKTRTLSIINALADLLCGETKLKFLSGNYRVTFDDSGETLEYVLEYRDRKVVREELTVAGKRLLERGEGGKGKILAQKEEKHIEFQTPENELAAVSRRDSIQHPFFEPLNEWGRSLYHYVFGKEMGQLVFGVLTKAGNIEFNPRATTAVVAAFRKGEKTLGDPFKESIKADMEAIGYPLDDLGITTPASVQVAGPLPGEVVCLYAKEMDLKCVTEQPEMSQGMFRALSVIVSLNYSKMASSPSCILIDDIGEGLDFERSCALIELLMRKAEESSVQLIMATNDRFVMNKVPLETWSVLQREGGECRVRNYANSKAVFDEFKFTGMSNFDFFAVDFANEEHHVNE